MGSLVGDSLGGAGEGGLASLAACWDGSQVAGGPLEYQEETRDPPQPEGEGGEASLWLKAGTLRKRLCGREMVLLRTTSS